MANEKKKPVKIVETVLRDAHQSLIATRMTTEQMLPIIGKMDEVGYHAVECWGGATFDASLRFLKEDPWERLRKLRDGFKKTKLQMLFRGQNILSAKQHLKFCLLKTISQLSKALPRIFLQETKAGIECRTAPAFYCMISNLIHLSDDRKHLLRCHSGCNQRLVRVTKDSFHDLNRLFLFICHSKDTSQYTFIMSQLSATWLIK